MMRIYVAISAIFVLVTLLLIILYKNIPVKSQEVQVDEIVEDIVEEEIPVPDSDSEYDSDSEDEDEILNGTTQGSSIKPPREKSPPKISQPQPTVPVRVPIAPSPQPSAPPPPASLEPLPPTPPAPPPPASLEPLPPTPPAPPPPVSLEPLPPTPPAPPPPRPTPTYTVSHIVRDISKTMTVNITNITNAHNSFVITFHGAAIPAGPNRKYEYPESVLKTHTLTDGETSFSFKVNAHDYGSYDYIVKPVSYTHLTLPTIYSV